MKFSTFYQAGKGRQIIVLQSDGNLGITSKKLSRAKFACTFGKWHGTDIEQEQNRAIKRAFYDLQVRLFGPSAADEACQKAGLVDNWTDTSRPLSGRIIKDVLAELPLFNLNIIKANEDKVDVFLSTFSNNASTLSAQLNAYQLQQADICHPAFANDLRQALMGRPDYIRFPILPHIIESQAIDVIRATRANSYGLIMGNLSLFYRALQNPFPRELLRLIENFMSRLSFRFPQSR